MELSNPFISSKACNQFVLQVKSFQKFNALKKENISIYIKILTLYMLKLTAKLSKILLFGYLGKDLYIIIDGVFKKTASLKDFLKEVFNWSLD
ncbi:MAG: hypothetical protein WBA39_20375 [Rivularia sp. (in: cyanobacteria)]